MHGRHQLPNKRRLREHVAEMGIQKCVHEHPLRRTSAFMAPGHDAIFIRFIDSIREILSFSWKERPTVTNLGFL